MIQIPYDQILDRLCEKSGESREAIEQKVQEKLDQLTNLVSKEGAAHIVANELGIKLLEPQAGRVKLKSVLSGMRNLEVLGKVRAVFEVREFATERSSGKVGSFILADETDSLRITCWHAQADKMGELKKEDIVKITGSYVRENQGKREIHLNDKSEMVINPPGETVDAVSGPLPQDAPRRKIADLSTSDVNVELLGTVVQTYDLRFFETCPDCRKRVKQKEGGLACDQHGVVTPQYSYVLNCFIDDGSENIRAVFFREQVEQLLGKSHEEVVAFHDFPDKFEDVKHELLGQIVKLRGKANKNEMFDRLEFMVRQVTVNPDPNDELKGDASA